MLFRSVEPGSGQTEPDAKPEEREGEGAEFVVVRRRRRRKIHDTASKDLPHGSAPESLAAVGMKPARAGATPRPAASEFR